MPQLDAIAQFNEPIAVHEHNPWIWFCKMVGVCSVHALCHYSRLYKPYQVCFSWHDIHVMELQLVTMAQQNLQLSEVCSVGC